MDHEHSTPAIPLLSSKKMKKKKKPGDCILTAIDGIDLIHRAKSPMLLPKKKNLELVEFGNPFVLAKYS